MHGALAAVLLASDHTATPSSEATDGIASPQHRRCASSRRRPSRADAPTEVASGACQFVSGGMARELFTVARRSCGCAAGKRQHSRRDAIGARRRRRDAGRACRPPEAGWAVHCHSSCPSPWATPLRNAHLLWRRRSAARSPPRTTHRGEASSTATAPSLRQAPLQSARAILQSVFAPLQSARGHSPVCFHTSPVWHHKTREVRIRIHRVDLSRPAIPARPEPDLKSRRPRCRCRATHSARPEGCGRGGGFVHSIR